MRRRLLMALPLAGVLALLSAFVVFASTVTLDPASFTELPELEPSIAGAEISPALHPTSNEIFLAAVSGGSVMPEGAVLRESYAAADTIHYRVCKDLTVCFLDVATPEVGVATPLFLPGAGPPLLTQVDVPTPASPPAAKRPRLWVLAAIPFLAVPLLERDHDEGVSPASGGGAGETPGSRPGVPIGPGPETPVGPETPPSTVTPEPATLVLIATGLAGLALLRRRRRADCGTT